MGMRISNIGLKLAITMLGVGLFCILQAFVMTPGAAALDNPHVSSNNVSCDNCHANPAALDFNNQGDQTNGVCGQCHNPSLTAPDVKPHATPKYGGTLIQCTECHNPHAQNQVRKYTTDATRYFQTGTLDTAVGAVTTTTLKLSAPLPALPLVGTTAPTSWAGLTIIPDKRYVAYMYRIAAYDSGTNTITIDTGKNGTETINTLIKPGAGYAIIYGQLVKEYVRGRAVKFFRPEGTNSFADGDATIDGVCQVCHAQTASFNSVGVLENGNHPAGQAGKKCSGCHDHNATSGGFTPQCNTCHGSPPDGPATLTFKYADNTAVTFNSATVAPVAGAHVKHTTAGYACVNCHTGGMLGGAPEGDNNINIGFNLGGTNLGGTYKYQARSDTPVAFGYAGGGTTTVANSTPKFECSNIYCHSSGQAANGGPGGPVYSAPIWNNAATGACGTCHNTTTINTGSHTAHLASAVTIQCENCHTGAGDGTAYSSANHVNQQINVSNSYTAAGTPGNGYGTCSVAACHGLGGQAAGSSPTWGTNFAGTDSCTRCHGTPTAAPAPDYAKAPPSDTAGDTAANDAQVGAHQAHLQATISSAVACSECHLVPAAVATAGHINDATPGVAEVDFTNSDKAKFNSATPNYAGGSCSTTYCHGARMPKSGTDGANETPSWIDTTYLNGTASHDCAQCHGYPPVAIGAHSGKGPTDCKGCHDDANPAGTGFDIVSQHIDKILQVSGCNGCHGQSGATGAPLIAADLVSPATGHGIGMHPTHVTTLNYTCNTCHNGNNMPTLDDVITVAFSGVAAGGAYDGNDATLNSPYSYSAGVTLNDTYSCSNVYCHGSTMAPNGGTDTTPEWTNASTGACGTCHGAAAATPPTKGSHLTHAGNYSYACSLCHNASGVHVNNQSEVLFDTADTRVSGASYNGTAAMLDAYGSCSATYCHGAGAPQWGGALADAPECDSCHGGNKTSTATAGLGPITTGKHTVHIANSDANLATFACGRCHSGTVTSGNDRSVTGAANHVNQTKDVAYDALNTGATNGTCNNLYCHSDGKGGFNNQVLATAWSTGPAIACTGCHGDNGTSQFGEPDYASGVAGSATANSHGLSAHVAAASDCGKCHASTSTNGTGITGTLHLDRNLDVVVSATIDNNGATANYDGTVGQKSCSATTCHGTLSPKWGTNNSTSKDCTKCHGRLTPTASYTTVDAAPGIGGTGKDTGGNTANTDAQVGAHRAHLEGTRNYSSAIACSECHTVPALFTTNGHIYDGTNDTTKGVAELIFGTLSKTGSLNPQYNVPTAGKCSTTWCHGAGLSGGDKVPTWNTPILTGVATNDCTQCHDYVPAPSGVGAHAGKVATDCISCHTHVNAAGTGFTDKTLHVNGIKEGGDNCSDCHSAAGGPTSGTTPDAYHARHVQTAFIGKLSTNDYGRLTGGTGPNWYTYSNVGGTPDMGCGYCHPTADTNHMNGSLNLNFNPADTGATGTLKAKNNATQNYSQIPGPPRIVTCSSVYCHSNGYNPGAGYGYQPSDNWYTVTVTGDVCAKCHGNYPNDILAGQTAGSAAHTAHAVGIHFDTLYTGTTGLMTTGTLNTDSHGNATTATTINCNVCHQGTVTMSRNKLSSMCNSCHSGDAAGNTMVIAAGSTTHVNGQPDISLVNLAGTLRSKAQIRGTTAPTPWTRNGGYKAAGANDSATLAPANYAAGTCTTACHQSQPVTWYSVVSCNSCHTTLP